MNVDENMKLNQKQRLEFVELWSKYVREHDDKEWSCQQNVIINSVLKTIIQPSKKFYLEVKGENYKDQKRRKLSRSSVNAEQSVERVVTNE